TIIAGQPYDSVQMMIESTDSRKVNKTKIINLIKAGAFDSIDKNRNKLLQEYTLSRNEDASMYPDRTNKTDIIKYEREMLGASVTIQSRWETIPDGKKNIQFTGVLMELDPFTSKKGQEHARVTLETNEDQLECMIFNRTWMPLK